MCSPHVSRGSELADGLLRCPAAGLHAAIQGGERQLQGGEWQLVMCQSGTRRPGFDTLPHRCELQYREALGSAVLRGPTVRGPTVCGPTQCGLAATRLLCTTALCFAQNANFTLNERWSRTHRHTRISIPCRCCLLQSLLSSVLCLPSARPPLPPYSFSDTRPAMSLMLTDCALVLFFHPHEGMYVN